MERRFMRTAEDVAQVVSTQRRLRGWTQQDLARRAGVGRRFIVDLERGHERAELSKVLGVLRELEVQPLALPAPAATGSMHDVDLDAVISAHG